MRTRISGGLAFVASLALAATGCGGSDGTASLTKAQFIKQADAICVKVDEEQLNLLVKENERSPIDGQGAAATERIVIEVGLPPIQDAAEKIKELGAPEGDEEQIEAIAQGWEEAVEAAEENPTKAEAAFAEVDKLSTQYGFKACSEAL